MTTASDKTAIRAALDAHAEAIRRKDAAAVLACFAPDLVTFDLAPPLGRSGAAARDRKGLEDWFGGFEGPIGQELRDFTIHAGGDLALCHGFIQLGATSKAEGEAFTLWMRATVGLRKIDGAWKIVHEHTSVPFYMDGSFRAATDLEP